MSKLKAALDAVGRALASKEARGPELALGRVVLLALGAKLGYDFEQWLGK